MGTYTEARAGAVACTGGAVALRAQIYRQFAVRIHTRKTALGLFDGSGGRGGWLRSGIGM